MNITLQSGDCGTYLLVADDGEEILIQTDWDFPGIASTFGWSPCHCGRTDGTVDCLHRTASAMIVDAARTPVTLTEIGSDQTMSHRVKIRKNSLTENLYLDRQGCWVPWKLAAWFNSDRAAEQFARDHGIEVFGLFPCESFGA